MNMDVLDTVVVGAGQAGLGVSYFLQQDGRKHIVFEHGRIGETWLSQRWDSFQLNTPNNINTLPGLPYDGPEPDGFWRPDELTAYFRQYTDRFHLPVRTGVTVLSVEQARDGERFLIHVQAGEQPEESVLSRSVVIAAGIQNAPQFPPVRSLIPGRFTQIHTSDYRNQAGLPPGGVVVVGSGQSGCQIAEDLAGAGRTVYLCTGKVGRAPRRYRGRDILDWLVLTKFWEVKLASLEDRSVTRAIQPQISGVGRYGHTLSLQYLASQGVVILGRLLDVDGNSIILSDEAAAHVHFADEVSQRFKNDIDAYLANAGIELPPNEHDPADLPDPEAKCASPLRRLDLAGAGIGTIIWATGFSADFRWIHLPVFDAGGLPIHEQGVSPLPGLYFLGFPWLNSRKSGIIYGIQEDAGIIAGAITKYLA